MGWNPAARRGFGGATRCRKTALRVIARCTNRGLFSTLCVAAAMARTARGPVIG
jgi:hypothetical protein